MRRALRTLRFLLAHPLGRRRRIRTVSRYLTWQIGSRLVPGPVAVPFVDDTRLLVTPGLTGATGNVYVGLHEFSDMAFVLHLLRPEDLFVDGGANVGSYTVLAAGAVGARCISVEPLPAAFQRLVDNVQVNRLGDRVELKNVGLAAEPGELSFTVDLDTVNHVIAAGETAASQCVPVEPLDALCPDRGVTCIKMDVEGYETEVVRGGERTLRSPGLMAVVMELNGSGARYGFDEEALRERMIRELGFTPCAYDVMNRDLLPTPGRGDGNTIYVRDVSAVAARLKSARRYRVLGFDL